MTSQSPIPKVLYHSQGYIQPFCSRPLKAAMYPESLGKG